MDNPPTQQTHRWSVVHWTCPKRDSSTTHYFTTEEEANQFKLEILENRAIEIYGPNGEYTCIED